MFSMCSELTPRARIPDTRIPQFMQPSFLQSFAPSAQRLSMYTYLMAAVPNRHLLLCLWHILLLALGGILVCWKDVVPLIWLFPVDQKSWPNFYFPLFVSLSQAWHHTFSFEDLDQTNHIFYESLSRRLTKKVKLSRVIVQLSTA